jgi:hypothetical protein
VVVLKLSGFSTMIWYMPDEIVTLSDSPALVNNVVGLRVLPRGHHLLLGDERHVVTIGSEPSCDIQIERVGVVSLHCFLTVIREERIEVWLHAAQGSPDVRINDVVIKAARLAPGQVIQIGPVAIVVLGGEATPRIQIVARSVTELISKALQLYGTLHTGAEGIGIPYSTFRDWLRRRGLLPSQSSPGGNRDGI